MLSKSCLPQYLPHARVAICSASLWISMKDKEPVSCSSAVRALSRQTFPVLSLKGSELCKFLWFHLVDE